MHVLPGILAMAVIVTASNILVQFPMGGYLTWGAVTYPFAFLVTDLVNRLQGAAAARRVVVAGFGVGLVCSIIGTQIAGEFGPLVTLRIAIGSGLAFLVAQLLDIALFDRLRQAIWWRAPLLSTVAASTLDTTVFFTIAFSATLVWLEPGNDVGWANAATPLLGLGPTAPFWLSLALADLCTKIGVAFLALIPCRAFVAKMTTPVA
jgi:uncharacterized integral membrane protein (TIGR00697 family)